jgi:hypothetical protein
MCFESGWWVGKKKEIIQKERIILRVKKSESFIRGKPNPCYLSG